jgi:hypothetical protein
MAQRRVTGNLMARSVSVVAMILRGTELRSVRSDRKSDLPHGQMHIFEQQLFKWFASGAQGEMLVFL